MLRKKTDCQNYKLYGLLILCLFFLDRVQAQERSPLSGRVMDSLSALPLSGVSVLIAGSATGTQTDSNGIFTIKAPANSVLTFNYVGYQQKQINIRSSLSIDVLLSPTLKDMDEVVVVGFGTQKRITVTGAVVSVQTKELKQSPAANLAVSLAGRLPGLTAVQKSGEPGRDVTQLFIRGQGTVNTQSPIVLVDGVERDLTYIDPNEVESVTILKDASSTAVFGVRGANGVILVTTKRGTSDIPVISFSAEYGAQDFTRMLDPVNSYNYAKTRNQALINDGLAQRYSAEQIEKFRLGNDPRFPDTDWNDILMKKYSLQQRYNLNVSGATKTVKYFVNGGYLNQGSQFKTEDDLNYDPRFKLDRYNFRSNIDVQLNKTLKAFLNIGGYLEKHNMPNGTFTNFNSSNGGKSANLILQSPALQIISYMHDLNATVPGPLAPDGSVVTVPALFNPAYGMLNRTGYIQQTRANIMATYGMEQSLNAITKGLTLKAVASFDARMINNLFATRSYSRSEYVYDVTLKGSDGLDSMYYRPVFADTKNSPLSILGERSFNSLSNFQGYLNYNRTFNIHSVTGLVLFNKQQTLIDADLPYNLIGFASRATYAYKYKYLFEFNAGYNGSEQFKKGRRFGFFPAVSAGWVVSNEKFLAGSDVITYLKLRGSYGEVGNDRIGSRRFLYLDDIQVVSGGYTGSLGGVGGGQRIVTNLLRNEELQWEVAKKSNVAVEVGLLNSINLVIDLWHERRNNILRNRGTIPALNGLASTVLPPVNIGVVDNKGYEIELNYNKKLRQVRLLAKLNLNYATNRQLFADEPLLAADYAYRYRQTGYRIGQRFGYIVDGYFNNADEIKSAPVQNVGGSQTQPGDFRYRDVNGDGIINDRDRVPLGYSNVPEYTFGSAFNIGYKGLDISILFQGAANVSNYYQGKGTFAGSGLNYMERHAQSWTAERYEAGDPILYPRLSSKGTSPSEVENTFFNNDASYIRLKNFEIGYTMANPMRWGAKTMRVYANGLNLITWDKLPTKNFDPEVSGDSSFPINRLYNLGINLTF
ncbi:SusC/RagA family TonB-linked outer membrane protein [Niabella sp. 22666]|uniref:SusC/RagA family TonB-linked outer membrane protein n=1 Tax=Niabella sp. 22666 TaxID=3453954 RepID=UPI003F841B49